MNSNTLNVGNDAPPPYSETDIYSTTSHSHSRSPHSPHPPTSHLSPNDDAASRISSSTAPGDVVFTPPETPRTTTATNALPEIPPSPSVALYLDGRPAPPVSQTEEPVVHTVAVKATSSPDDLPYQSQWAARDVTVQDWATFVNFLMPDHDATRNEAILGEKGATEGSVSEGSEKRVPEQAEDPALRRRQAEAMVQQWNDGFFGPRGIRVQLSPEEEQSRMPGAWDNTFDEGQTPQAGPSVPREAGPSTQRAGRGNMNFGGFTFGNDSIRYGDSFVADSNGLRIGSLVMDNNGIRMDHRRQMPLAPLPRGGPPFGGHHHHHHHGPPFGGPPGHQPPWAAPHEADDRGRPAHQDPKAPRSRDSSTSSSSSSDSSDSSDSIGSLPDYDDVKDQQLPLYISRLESWTGNPQQMRTKAEVKQLKAEIKVNKSSRLPDDVDKAALRAQIKTLMRQWQQLKKQQKRTRREHKRERRQRRRAEKRERRQQRRDMKRAQKDHRKGRNVPPQCGPGPQIHVPPINVPPVNVPPINVPIGGPSGHASQVHVPPVHVPPVHVPPVPVPPPPFSGPSCGWGRGGRGGRGCGPRERSFFGPNGPFGRNGAFGGENGPLGHQGFFGSGGPFGPRGSVGGFGRGRGRGCGGGPFGSGFHHHSDPGVGGGPGPRGNASHDRYPGSWPDEQGGADAPQTGVTETTPAPGPASAEKYRVVADLETEIIKKTESLSSAPSGEKKAAEKEIEALLEKLENVRLEADETYARELAAILEAK